MTVHRQALLVAALALTLGVAIATPPLHGLPIAVFGAVLVGIALTLGARRTLLIAIAALPFTQSPTLKLGVRLRLSEVLLWLLIAGFLRVWSKNLVPVRVARVIAGLAIYLGVTSVVGIAFASSEPSLSNSALNAAYFYNPIFRTMLESGRVVAALGLLVGVVLLFREEGDVARLTKWFVAGATVAAAYGVYMFVLGSAAPVLPGTLEFTGRSASTFFEPTGFGTCSTIALLLLPSAKLGRAISVVAAALLFTGLLTSQSRTGLVALAIGIAVLLVAARGNPRTTVAAVSALAIGFWVLSSYVGRLPVSQRDRVTLGGFYFEQAVNSRTRNYGDLAKVVKQHPFGVGQGNYVYIGGGAPGILRLAAEGGIPGSALLLFIEAQVVMMLRDSYRTRDRTTRTQAIFLGGAHAATLVVLANYIYTTDVWLWLSVALICSCEVARAPTLAGVAEAQR